MMIKNEEIKKEEIKCNNIIKQYKNVLLWLYCKRRHKRTSCKLARITDHPYEILIIEGSYKSTALSDK